VKIAVDAALVARYVTELAQFGAHGEGGVWRLVYSPEWVAAQDCVTRWCQEAGLDTHRDAVGNVWGRLNGTEGGKAVVTGSHIDSQAPGGRFDGALGVIGAVVAVRTLRERFGTPRRPIEVVSLCEEEGSRFPEASFWGSRAITGQIGPGDAEQIQSADGETIAQAMRSVGLDPAQVAAARRDDIEAFLELHIEQGPLLEEAGLPVGVVDAITGLRHYLVELVGRCDHAGARPMDTRLDAMAGAAEVITGVIGHARSLGRPAVTTVGTMAVEPNLKAAVPERVVFTVDVRHPDPESLSRLYDHHESLIRSVAARRGLKASWKLILEKQPRRSDPELVRVIEAIARELEIGAMTMHSGGGHDAQRMADVTRAAMIFVRSRGGRSHTPEEFTSTDDAVAGITVLAAALYRLAY
jgi:allantoate deiminase